MTVTLESIALPTAIAPGMATYRIDGGPEPVRVVQPFRRGPPHYENGRPMWGWDGREPVTLTPSFDVPTKGWRLHCFLVDGQIRLCADSTVRT